MMIVILYFATIAYYGELLPREQLMKIQQSCNLKLVKRYRDASGRIRVVFPSESFPMFVLCFWWILIDIHFSCYHMLSPAQKTPLDSNLA